MDGVPPLTADFPAVRQLVAEAVSPVLRLRGGGVEAEAASPAPAPPLYPLPPDTARIAVSYTHLTLPTKA